MPLKDPEARRAYRTKYMRERWYPANAKKHRALVKASKDKRVALLARMIDKLKAVACADCDYLFPPVCMDFDHLPGAGKLAGISKMVRTGWPEAKILLEVKKCEVVCSNCHRLRTMKRRKAKAASGNL